MAEKLSGKPLAAKTMLPAGRLSPSSLAVVGLSMEKFCIPAG